MHMCIYAYIYSYIYIHIYVYTFMYVYIHVCMYVYMYIYIYIDHSFVISGLEIAGCGLTLKRVCWCFIYMYMYVCIYTYIHIYWSFFCFPGSEIGLTRWRRTSFLLATAPGGYIHTYMLKLVLYPLPPHSVFPTRPAVGLTLSRDDKSRARILRGGARSAMWFAAGSCSW